MKKRHRKFDIRKVQGDTPSEDILAEGKPTMKPAKSSRTKRDLKNWQELIDQEGNGDWKAVRDKGFEHPQQGHKEHKRDLIKHIRPKTANQQHYFNCIDTCSVTLCTGPAGTGKTYMACGIAIERLLAHQFTKIVLTRPIVECGSNLGILPGGIAEKTDPYMAPMFDSLSDFIDRGFLTKLKDQGLIEVCPLETMRGRSFNDTFMILDEAQNATHKQLKMFLTRIGLNSKVVVCGDVTQSDLKHVDKNPLLWAWDSLSHPDIAKVTLEAIDVQRHGLVRYILENLKE
jgi:phosphate starvation-inducible PhoH-like protein